MSKIFSALLLALCLAPLACDDPDDDTIERADDDATTTTTGDTTTDTTTGDDDDDKTPSDCLNALQLPPGPATALNSGC